jgi:diguanylate cyclase (GGDEF)-like protein
MQEVHRLQQRIMQLERTQDKFTQVEEGLRKQNAYLTFLHEIALSLMNRLGLEDLLEDIVKRACDLMNTPHGYIYLLEPEVGLLEVKVGLGLYRQYVGAYREKGKALSGIIWETGQAMMIENYRSWEGRAAMIEQPYGWEEIRSAMGAPLKSGHEVVGVIGLGFEEIRRFNQDDLDFLCRFAALASIALDNANLYCALQEELAERKKAEQQLKRLSLYDAVTGLYNRAYFEQQMQQFELGGCISLGIIVCDVDGLKLVNDTLGHHMGDKMLLAAADVLKASLWKGDIIARIGGDEFSILMPNSDKRDIEAACQRIRDAIEKYNKSNPKIPLSISVGFAVSNTPKKLSDLFKEADNNMYRDKLFRRRSGRSSIVQTLMKALDARDFITQGHVEHLQELIGMLAVKLGLSKEKISDLCLLAKFHDIGKVGVSDNILFKPSPLNPEEIVEVQQHCELGYRIAQSAPELSPIADWILKHHEWWDGNGYPFGLKEEEIPLECRILAIVDAYDVMTSDRPYRRALSHEEAIAELTRCAGSQFDPALVKIFVQVLKEHKEIQENF